MYEVRVYRSNRDIPWKGSHIHLIVGVPLQTDNKEMVDHFRKYHQPKLGRGIAIKEIESKLKSVRSMSLDELREFAISKGVEFDDSDSRMEIMKKIRGDN